MHCEEEGRKSAYDFCYHHLMIISGYAHTLDV